MRRLSVGRVPDTDGLDIRTRHGGGLDSRHNFGQEKRQSQIHSAGNMRCRRRSSRHVFLQSAIYACGTDDAMAVLRSGIDTGDGSQHSHRGLFGYHQKFDSCR